MLTRPFQRRPKMFGEGRLTPLDRNAKVRIQTLARALMRRTEPGKHYGTLTAKFVAVLDALLWSFHNSGTGRCFPSYERIAERADCDRSTVYSAVHALERAGVLTWVNRIKRIREWGVDLFGKAQNRERVVGLRTSTHSLIPRNLVSLSFRLEPRTNYLFFLRCPPNWIPPTPFIPP